MTQHSPFPEMGGVIAQPQLAIIVVSMVLLIPLSPIGALNVELEVQGVNMWQGELVWMLTCVTATAPHTVPPSKHHSHSIATMRTPLSLGQLAVT